MSHFSQAVAEATAERSGAVGARTSEEASAVRAGAMTFVAVTVADLLLLAAAYWAIHRYAAHRRRVEAALAAAHEAAEAANRAKDRVLATVSHDLRTPLTGIVLWAEIAATSPAADDDVRMAAAAITESAKSQARLIDDLLDASKTLGGRLRIEFAPVDLAQIVRDACGAVRPAAQAKGVDLVADAVPAGPMTVHGDALRLQQIVWNLAGNAIKFTPAGGRVTVALERDDGDGGDGPGFKLTVRDTGAGIDPADLPHVFEAFYQGEPGHAGKVTGVGLGLAIVRQLVDRHGGAVSVASPGKGHGTTFTVRLPAAEPARPAAAAQGRLA
jgi:signal transduction histidine kinase